MKMVNKTGPEAITEAPRKQQSTVVTKKQPLSPEETDPGGNSKTASAGDPDFKIGVI